MTLRLLQFSDVENAVDDPAQVGRLAATVAARRDDHALVCGTGDNTAPGLLAMETGADGALAFFDAVAPDYGTFGNHDFDTGIDEVRRVVAESPQHWLSANLRDADTGDAFAADLGVDPWTTTTVDGHRVGLFGLTDPETVRAHHVATEHLDVRDPVAAATEAADALRDAGVDLVVCLSHLGDVDRAVADAADVDVMLGGHTHAAEATVEDGTVFTRPAERGTHLAEVTVDADGSLDASLVPTADATPDPGVRDALQAVIDDVGLDEVVATTSDPVAVTDRARFPESRLGNLHADAFRWAADADVALVNAPMFRVGPSLAGEVTVADVMRVAPFDNQICAETVDGETLRAQLAALATESRGHHEVRAHVAGADLAWHRTEQGLDLVDVAVGGEPLDPDRTYRVAGPSFVFASDIYPHLSPDAMGDGYGHQHEVVADYLREVGVPTGTDGRQRAVVDEAGDGARTFR
jgi:2',3'-cyclic-nucleotide 2'-phosphodiesterase (5'-nucleotidase family)